MTNIVEFSEIKSIRNESSQNTKKILDFKTELTSLINRYGFENSSHTPDYMLAEYMISALKALNVSINTREKWYGRGNNE